MEISFSASDLAAARQSGDKRERRSPLSLIASENRMADPEDPVETRSPARKKRSITFGSFNVLELSATSSSNEEKTADLTAVTHLLDLDTSGSSLSTPLSARSIKRDKFTPQSASSAGDDLGFYTPNQSEGERSFFASPLVPLNSNFQRDISKSSVPAHLKLQSQADSEDKTVDIQSLASLFKAGGDRQNRSDNQVEAQQSNGADSTPLRRSSRKAAQTRRNTASPGALKALIALQEDEEKENDESNNEVESLKGRGIAGTPRQAKGGSGRRPGRGKRRDTASPGALKDLLMLRDGFDDDEEPHGSADISGGKLFASPSPAARKRGGSKRRVTASPSFLKDLIQEAEEGVESESPEEPSATALPERRKTSTPTKSPVRGGRRRRTASPGALYGLLESMEEEEGEQVQERENKQQKLREEELEERPKKSNGSRRRTASPTALNEILSQGHAFFSPGDEIVKEPVKPLETTPRRSTRRRQTASPGMVLELLAAEKDASPDVEEPSIPTPSVAASPRRRQNRRATASPSALKDLIAMAAEDPKEEEKELEPTESATPTNETEAMTETNTPQRPKRRGGNRRKTASPSALFDLIGMAEMEGETSEEPSEEQAKANEQNGSAMKPPELAAAMSPPPPTPSGTKIVALKSCLSSKKRKPADKTPGKSVVFGSPSGAEFNLNDPVTNFTPLAKRDVKRWFPLDGSSSQQANGTAEEEEDEETSLNSSMLEEADMFDNDGAEEENEDGNVRSASKRRNSKGGGSSTSSSKSRKNRSSSVSSSGSRRYSASSDSSGGSELKSSSKDPEQRRLSDCFDNESDEEIENATQNSLTTHSMENEAQQESEEDEPMSVTSRQKARQQRRQSFGGSVGGQRRGMEEDDTMELLFHQQNAEREPLALASPSSSPPAKQRFGRDDEEHTVELGELRDLVDQDITVSVDALKEQAEERQAPTNVLQDAEDRTIELGSLKDLVEDEGEEELPGAMQASPFVSIRSGRNQRTPYFSGIREEGEEDIAEEERDDDVDKELNRSENISFTYTDSSFDQSMADVSMADVQEDETSPPSPAPQPVASPVLQTSLPSTSTPSKALELLQRMKSRTPLGASAQKNMESPASAVAPSPVSEANQRDSDSDNEADMTFSSSPAPPSSLTPLPSAFSAASPTSAAREGADSIIGKIDLSYQSVSKKLSQRAQDALRETVRAIEEEVTADPAPLSAFKPNDYASRRLSIAPGRRFSFAPSPIASKSIEEGTEHEESFQSYNREEEAVQSRNVPKRRESSLAAMELRKRIQNMRAGIIPSPISLSLPKEDHDDFLEHSQQESESNLSLFENNTPPNRSNSPENSQSQSEKDQQAGHSSDFKLSDFLSMVGMKQVIVLDAVSSLSKTSENEDETKESTEMDIEDGEEDFAASSETVIDPSARLLEWGCEEMWGTVEAIQELVTSLDKDISEKSTPFIDKARQAFSGISSRSIFNANIIRLKRYEETKMLSGWYQWRTKLENGISMEVTDLLAEVDADLSLLQQAETTQTQLMEEIGGQLAATEKEIHSLESMMSLSEVVKEQGMIEKSFTDEVAELEKQLAQLEAEASRLEEELEDNAKEQNRPAELSMNLEKSTKEIAALTEAHDLLKGLQLWKCIKLTPSVFSVQFTHPDSSSSIFSFAHEPNSRRYRASMEALVPALTPTGSRPRTLRRKYRKTAPVTLSDIVEILVSTAGFDSLLKRVRDDPVDVIHVLREVELRMGRVHAIAEELWELRQRHSLQISSSNEDTMARVIVTFNASRRAHMVLVADVDCCYPHLMKISARKTAGKISEEAMEEITDLIERPSGLYLRDICQTISLKLQ